ncbi:hypothetical protein BgiBS90_012837 [Biomphalaria glabrata]|nr:hypothetical protein BgiBS90_012837 [Biomphalaria glabrata]
MKCMLHSRSKNSLLVVTITSAYPTNCPRVPSCHSFQPKSEVKLKSKNSLVVTITSAYPTNCPRVPSCHSFQPKSEVKLKSKNSFLVVTIHLPI